jgi:hypothetical protein
MVDIDKSKKRGAISEGTGVLALLPPGTVASMAGNISRGTSSVSTDLPPAQFPNMISSDKRKGMLMRIM